MRLTSAEILATHRMICDRYPDLKEADRIVLAHILRSGRVHSEGSISNAVKVPRDRVARALNALRRHGLIPTDHEHTEPDQAAA